MGTVFAGSVLLCVACMAIRTLIRDKKQGKSTCGGDCSRCRGCR